MPGKTAIGWTNLSWNPTTGCTHVSPGCEHCYAETLSNRYGWTSKPWIKPFEAENLVLHPERLRIPLGNTKDWREPSMVFVDSMSDLFHELVPDAYIEQVFAVMALAEKHTFQVLTKRPERMREFLADPYRWVRIEGRAQNIYEDIHKVDPSMWLSVKLPLPNVWLGTSVEDQRRAEERIPHLIATPAAIRFLSCEPLLGHLDLLPWLMPDCLVCEGSGSVEVDPGCFAACGSCYEDTYGGTGVGLSPIQWVITGGESGPVRRPADVFWFRQIRDQVKDSARGVSYFHKQGNAFKSGKDRELDGRTWDEIPERTKG